MIFLTKNPNLKENKIGKFWGGGGGGGRSGDGGGARVTELKVSDFSVLLLLKDNNCAKLF